MTLDFQDVTVTNLVIREWLNGSLFPLSINLALIIAIFIWDSYIDWLKKPTTKRWWNADGVPTACALFWIFLLDGVRAISVWAVIWNANNGATIPDWIRALTNYALTIASVGLILTMLRCAYLFTPPRWGHAFWIYSAVSTLLFLALGQITH
jgi:hypothetical protein